MTTATDYTSDELFSTCIARQIKDGECVAQGIATPLTIAGYFLAKLTHAPNLLFAVAVGNLLTGHWSPLSLGHVEWDYNAHSLIRPSFAQTVCEILPALHPKEFLRPAQIDPQGNFNNVVVGNYQRPRVRLPGSGGIPDVTVFGGPVHLYNPRHSRSGFVPRLDFVSGVGVRSEEEKRSQGIRCPGPAYMVTDLGQFDFANGRLRLTTYHPGVTPEQVQARTGFPLEIAPDVQPTPPPTTEDVRLLRDVIDPLGIRKIEMLSGGERWALLEAIARQEEQDAGRFRRSGRCAGPG